MQRVRWWTAGLISRIDGIVSQVENHEAVAHSAIREVRQAAARARVQLARVKRDGEELRRRLHDEREAEASWRERARRVAAEDEARALECLRRAKRSARLAGELERRLAEHERAEGQLVRDVARVEERLGSLTERHNLLRTRQSRAEALAIARDAGAPLCAQTSELFERWETQVTERELVGACTADEGDDAFAAEFDAHEESEDLREELAELLRTDEEATAAEDPNHV